MNVMILVLKSLFSHYSQAELYTGGLPDCPTNTHGRKLHQIYRNTLKRMENIMAGYTFPEEVCHLYLYVDGI